MCASACRWLAVNAENLDDLAWFLVGYVLWALVAGFLFLVANMSRTRWFLVAAARAHHTLLDTVMHAPLTFFSTTPAGRIINRFSRDMDAVDIQIPTIAGNTLAALMSVAAVVLLVIIANPWTALGIVPLVIFYWWIRRYYHRVFREIQRLENISASPIFTQFQETLDGLSSIRAYGMEKAVMEEHNKKLETSLRTTYANMFATTWISLR